MKEVKSTSNLSLERDINFDILRVLAVLAVIVVHVSGTGLLPGRDYQLGSFEWFVCLINSSFVRWSVPIFVMISGVFFLNPNKEVQVRKLFFKYILRIFIALVVWSSFYAWAFKGNYLPLGHNAGNHLWYLSMIIGVYLTIPILRTLSIDQMNYFIVIWFVFVTLSFINKVTESSFQLFEIENYFFLGYTGYFVLGQYLFRIEKSQKMRYWIYFIGFVSFLATFIGSYLMSLYNGKTTQSFFNYFSPNVIFMSIAVFVLISNLNLKISQPIIKRFIYSLSKNSFGIYLLHMFLLIHLYTRIVRFIPNPILFIPIITLVTFGIAYVVTLLLRKIPYISKYIV